MRFKGIVDASPDIMYVKDRGRGTIPCALTHRMGKRHGILLEWCAVFCEGVLIHMYHFIY